MEEQSTSSSASSKQTAQSVFAVMPPKFAFWAGIVAATAVIAIIGFIIMLVLVLSDGTSGSKTSGTSNTNVAAANTNAAGAAAAVPTGKIDDKDLRNVKGKGDFTLVEFSDFECPFCAQFEPTIKQVLKDYDGKLKFAYNHFPLNIHPTAQLQAEASECAAEQGKFWEYHEGLFSSSTRAKQSPELVALAEQLGMNKGDFESCLNSGKMKERVTADADLAQALGAQGTPYSLILDKDGNIVSSIPGAYPLASVKSTIDGVLAGN